MRTRPGKWLTIGLMALFALIVHQTDLSGKPSPRFVTFYPAETDEVLDNPYMGLAGDARDDDMPQPVRLVHANAYWKDLEPSPGEYDFASFERGSHFDEWRRQGVKIVLRFIMDYPRDAKHMDIPQWLYDELDGDGTWYDLDIGQGFSPNYGNERLIAAHREMIQALGERYDDDPLIAFVELGSVGHWGEWHTWDRDPLIPFPKRAVADRYVEPYLEFFGDKPLLMRRPHQIAADNGMGLYNDAFGKTDATIDEFLDWFHNGYESWLTGEMEPAMPDFWATAPSGGEFPDPRYYVSDERIEETLRQARLTHITWVGPNAPVQEPYGGEYQQNIDELLKTIGYRFAASRVTHEEWAESGDRLHLAWTVANRGVAPFYFPWHTKLSLWNDDDEMVAQFDVDWDVRDWLPGETTEQAVLPLPPELAPGRYTLRLAVIDPETDKPGIQFANAGAQPSRWVDISSLYISER